jgi:hypothetical protein
MLRQLLPFAPTPSPLDIKVDIEFQQDLQCLDIVYHLTGDLESIDLVNQPCQPKSRADELWKNTCFEWFLKSPKDKQYWEFNASPTGNWNFYHLDDYRENLKPCTLIEAPELQSKREISKTNFTYTFFIRAPLALWCANHSHLIADAKLAVTAVIRWKSGECSYFSLRHPEAKADFHHEFGFQHLLIQSS